MPTNEPCDAAGNPLRRPAQAAAAGGWAAWQRWGEEVNRALRSKADTAVLKAALAALNRNDDAILDALERTIKRLDAGLQEERQQRQQLAAAALAELERLEARLARLEIGGRSGPPKLSEAEVGSLKQKLRSALAVGLDELAEQRLAAGANGHAVEGAGLGALPRLGGQA